jgi:hypothetical protein
MNTYELSRTTPVLVTHGHRAHKGFCTVCGSVWPCYRAPQADIPTTTTSRAVPVLV